jgi:hypothetical protein
MKTLKFAAIVTFCTLANPMLPGASASALTLPGSNSAASTPIELVASKHAKHAKQRQAAKNQVTSFCYDSAFRCIQPVRGVCNGYLYTDFWGEKRCSRYRNGRRQAQFGFSWGTGFDW